jgi:dTDP-4-amino-4,6-dideoxygalactose transaminase
VEIPIWPQAGEREAELLATVLNSPHWGGFHPFVQEFEESFAAYQHSKYGISAMNGTVTLEMALTALDIGPRDEVIVPAISFVSTATAVSRVGALPVFVDIEPWSFNMDPQRVAEAITPSTRAIMPVHFAGIPADMDTLSSLARAHDLLLIEDAAQAHGSEWRGRRAGSFGVCGSFSFQNGKVLCAGEGGMVVTSRADLAEKIRAIANQGRKVGESFYKHFTLGTNFRLTAFQAAVLIAQFESLPEQIVRRSQNATLLKELLAGCDQIMWQAVPPEVTQSSMYLMPGRLLAGAITRDDLCKRLTGHGVPCTPFYPFPLYKNPLYQQQGSCRVMPCPMTEAYVADAFWLPHRVLLSAASTIEEIGTVFKESLSVR